MSELSPEQAEFIARDRWNSSADEFNQWSELGSDERADLIAKVLREHKSKCAVQSDFNRLYPNGPKIFKDMEPSNA